MRDLFGMLAAAPEPPPASETLSDEDLTPPPLARTVLPPGARLIVFGAPGRAASECPLTGAPAIFGACLGCAHWRGPAGLGMACGYTDLKIGRL